MKAMHNRNSLLLTSSLYLLSGCTGSFSSEDSTTSIRKHEVYLYASNRSSVDSLAPVFINIDDSVYLNIVANENIISSEKLQKVVRIGEGPHRIHARFGRYSRDTTLRIDTVSSLVLSMHYNPQWEPKDNGMMINLFVRDGKDRGGD